MAVEEIIFVLDKIGIVAFAFAGVSKGVQKKLDIFGLLVVGILTAIGGGIIRDLLVARVPYAIANPDYLFYAFGASIIFIIVYALRLKIPEGTMKIGDTIGLGVFAAAGAVVALGAGLGVLHAIIFAVITAVVGGMLRDILVNETPFVLKKEVYATAAGFGGLSVFLASFAGFDFVTASIVGITVTILIRTYSMLKKINLPVLKT